METNNFNYVRSQDEAGALSKTFVANVFSWMFAALTITSIIAYSFGTNKELESLLYGLNELGLKSPTTLGYITMFSPFAFILLISFGFNRISYPILLLLFLLFAGVMGISLSSVFLIYSESSIYSTFGISAGMFGLMAIVGYTTKTDLTKFGSIMMMGLVGIIIASIIEWIFPSPGLNYIISVIGVLVFTGLTAYDVQKLKRIGAGIEFGTATASKLVIMGALNLYMDFINLFMFMLRLFGNSKN